MSAKGKINWILILQGWAMLWVVLGHAPLGVAGEGPAWENVIWNIAYSFHMSLFILISGYLFFLTRISPDDVDGHHKWNYLNILKDKALRLLLPMLFFTLLAYVLKWAFPSEMDRAVSLGVSGLVRAFLFPYNGPLREMWFIYTLFLLFALTPLWRLALRGWKSEVITAAVLLACHFWDPDVEFLSAGRVLDYGIWFFAGLLLAKYQFIAKLKTSVQLPLLLVSAALAVAGHLLGCQFAVTVGLIAASFAIALLLDRTVPGIFGSFRNYTYQIFLMGIFAQMAVKIAFRHFTLPYFAGWLICVAAGLYVPVAISAILLKINCRPLLALVGLKSLPKN